MRLSQFTYKMKRLSVCIIPLAAALCASAALTPQDALRQAGPRFEPSPNAPGVYLGRGFSGATRISATDVTVKAGPAQVRMSFDHASPSASIQGGKRLASQSNYLIGSDRSAWRTGLPNFRRLDVNGLYRGIDLSYYATEGRLEYDLMVRPGADPGAIRLRFEGEQPKLDREGNLAGHLTLKRPIAYQNAADGSRIEVASRFRRNADGTYGFSLGRYDRNRTLVIDPVLTLAQYLSGTSTDIARAVGHDSKGFIYVAGSTSSPDFNLSSDAHQSTRTGTTNIFLVKIDPRADPSAQVIYSTYLGGSGADILTAMAVTPSGKACITGNTSSSDFPGGGTINSSLGGKTDVFLACVDPSLAGGNGLLYAATLGGSGDETSTGIVVDSKDRMGIVGITKSTDFPVVNGFQSALGGKQDAFVAFIDPFQRGTASILYSTYLGGSAYDEGRGIALASDGTLWVAGGTCSNDFPVAGNGYQLVYAGGCDGFVAQINPSATVNSLLYSSFLGGAGEETSAAIRLGPGGQVVVTGYTTSSDFPVTPNTYQRFYGGGTDAYISVFNPALSGGNQLVYSTYFGGTGGESGFDLQVDSAGIVYVTGFTGSPDMAVTKTALQNSANGGFDGFLIKLNPATPAAAALEYSSYIASDGSQLPFALDLAPDGTLYVAGYASGPVFDGLGGPSKPNGNGDLDGFVMGVNPCNYSRSLNSEQFPASGGTDTVQITTASSCQWIASSSVDWVTVNPSNGRGNGSVTIKVAANSTGQPRTASITVGSTPFLIGQDQ